MNRRLVLNTVRSVKNTKSRFIAIMAIIAIGSGFFAGVKSAGPDMKLSAADYLNKQGLSDIHIMSDLGLDDEDVAAAKSRVDADEVYAGYTADLMMSDGSDNEKIVKLYSYDPNSGINKPYVTEGRLPEAPDEVFADNRFFNTGTPNVGDRITLRSGSEDTEIEDVISRTEYTIVGKGLLPVYVSFERGSTSIGNGIINGWILVPEENFTYEVYTDLFISLAETDGTDPYLDSYDEAVGRNKDILEEFGKTQIEHRKSVVTDEAYEKINDAKKKLEDGKRDVADAEKKLADGKKDVADGEKEIEDGKRDLADGEKDLEDGKKEVADGEKDLEDAKKEIADAEKELADGKKDLEDAKKDLADAEKKLADGKKELADAEKEVADGRKKLEDGEKEYADGKDALDGLKEFIGSLENIISAYQTNAADMQTFSRTSAALEESGMLDDALKQLLMGYMLTPAAQDDGTKAASKQALERYVSALQDNAGEAEKELDDARSELDNARKEIEDGEAEIASHKKEIADAEKEMSDGKKEIADAEKKIADAEKEISDGKKEISDGEKELEDARQELADGENDIEKAKQDIADAEKKIADGKKDIADGEKEIADAKKDIEEGEKELADAEDELREKTEDAEWHVFDREFYPSYSNYAEDCERVDAIAAVFPVFFILVAALVCCTTMTRMVEEQRTETGTVKALGYSRYSIMSQYIMYSLAASIPGGFIGLLIGFNTLPPVIYKCYVAMYNQPYIIYPFRWDYAAGCIIAACLCTGLSALYASRAELVSCPAQLMRPKPPKNGKRILLERIGFIWNRLRFTTKVTCRNLFRYKARLLMTVTGIAGCTALLLTGFGLYYSISSIVDKQYGDIFKYDALVVLDKNADDEEYAEVWNACGDTGLASAKMYIRQETVDISSDDNTMETYILVAENPQSLEGFIDLHERKSRERITLGDGVVLGEKLARMLGVKAGDSVYFDGRTPVKVTAVCENYTFSYAYMTRDVYAGAGFEDEYRHNMIMLNMKDVTEANEDALSSAIVKYDAVLAVSLSSRGGDKFRDLISSLSMIIVVIIAAAGALAFVVLFNLSNININERVHELATIKVLGFFDGEVAAYVYRENILLTVMGTAAGLVIGIFFEKFVIKTAEVDTVMFSAEIPYYCFIAAAALTFLFSLLVNVTLYFKLKKIDMASSLKAIE